MEENTKNARTVAAPGRGTDLDWDFCSSSSPCTYKQGDCDANSNQCVQDHVCGVDNCIDFWSDAHPNADCCIPGNLSTSV